MSAPKLSANEFLAAAKYRRTVYGLKGTSKVPDSRVQEIVEEVLGFAPSSYNTQPVRVTLVTGEKHTQFWDIVIKTAEPILKGAGEAVWDKMSGIMQSHKASYGSVVFWEDTSVTEAAKKTHVSYAHMFESFGEHATGMNQILVWTALELEGLGANLQHMNGIPPVEEALKKFLAVPASYRLRAHLNYGDEPAAHSETVPAKLPTSETFKYVN
ncbi:hypothetical protein LLEC1_06753 [Akanthomyces lecanii]|uniref:Nitroreductase domain-containing protein n=1 Tax=Cordyceps confragosa TaxID=2714763 RepID=A0A179I2T2_CORDF|nr:hypothetical protein LLEC1_06753 [Akanthomyces lecanii]